MRAIKFRGKRTDNREWVYGDLTKLITPEGNVGYFIITENKGDFRDDVPVNSISYTLYNDIFLVLQSSIGQFTGLCDKNNKEIYEGDIVEFINVDLPDCVIVYDNGSFMYRELGEDISLEELRLQFTVEVIGNIYDNPELLK